MDQKREQSLQLMRHFLSSIDLSDLEEDKDLSTEDRKGYCAAISAVWPRLEKDMKRFLHLQLMFGNNNAETWEQVLFSRGTFNGIDLLLEHWKKAHEEHIAKGRPEEKFDEHNPMGEL